MSDEQKLDAWLFEKNDKDPFFNHNLNYSEQKKVEFLDEASLDCDDEMID
jgi:hypothetical protein